MSSDLDRLRRSYRVDPSGCWLWQKHISRKGYGQTARQVDGRRQHLKAHRFAYELLIGPIPAGLELDHLCRVRHCVNPAHLEPVTHAVNVKRGIHTGTGNQLKTHCAHGHPFDDVNTLVIVDSDGRHRACRTCHREHEAARRARLRRAV